MDNNIETLPTSAADASTNGGANDTATTADGGSASKSPSAFAAKASELKGQAADKALGLAAQGKDRASDVLDQVARLVEDAASQVEGRLGGNAADYLRKASGSVSGFAGDLRGKDIEDLIDDARETVKRNPAIAMGAAAALGFLVARLARSAAAGSSTTDSNADANSKS